MAFMNDSLEWTATRVNTDADTGIIIVTGYRELFLLNHSWICTHYMIIAICPHLSTSSSHVLVICLNTKMTLFATTAQICQLRRSGGCDTWIHHGTWLFQISCSGLRHNWRLLSADLDTLPIIDCFSNIMINHCLSSNAWLVRWLAMWQEVIKEKQLLPFIASCDADE